jgi:hypothetical protein
LHLSSTLDCTTTASWSATYSICGVSFPRSICLNNFAFDSSRLNLDAAAAIHELKLSRKATLSKLKAKEKNVPAPTRRSDIQSWVTSAATTMNGGDSSDEGPTWQKDRVLDDWESSMEYAQHVLVGGKTKLRISFLQDELLSLAKHAGRSIIRDIVFVVFTTIDLNLSQIMDLFKLLTLTYPRYLDARSREAVEAVGMELIRRDEMHDLTGCAPVEAKFGVAEQIVGWLSNEVGRLAKRGSPR